MMCVIAVVLYITAIVIDIIATIAIACTDQLA